jgi:hypothetical protein
MDDHVTRPTAAELASRLYTALGEPLAAAHEAVRTSTGSELLKAQRLLLILSRTVRQIMPLATVDLRASSLEETEETEETVPEPVTTVTSPQKGSAPQRKLDGRSREARALRAAMGDAAAAVISKDLVGKATNGSTARGVRSGRRNVRRT